jgi:hypothetical protein
VAAAVGGYAEIRGYGPMVGDARAWPDVRWPVVAFIAGWVLLTLAILAVWVRKLR